MVYIVSDACLGHGSPQIISLARALTVSFPCDITIVEPDVPSLPPQHASFPELSFTRIRTTRHVFEEGGRAAYCRRAARVLNKVKPDVLILVCTFTIPVLLSLKRRPPVVVFYSIESIIQYGLPDIHLNRFLRDKIDLILWPEETRKKRDTQRCGFESISSLLVLNSSNPRSSAGQVEPAGQRLPRIIHQGTIGVKHTFADYFLRREILRLPIDIYGPLVDDESRRLEQYRPTAMDRPKWARTFYHGRVTLDQLAKIRRRHAYSLCIWNPETERGLFAPSNKFFEAVADGVPPITAPHPQHVRLVEKYDCGIVLDDWSLTSLRKGLLLALRIFGTMRYEQLVQNCRKAVQSELNAETQFGAAARAIGALTEKTIHGTR